MVDETERRVLQRAADRLSGQLPEGAYGPEFVNVADQQRDPDSLLELHPHAGDQRYRDCPELGWGTFEILEQPYAAVLAHRCTWDDGSIVAAAQLRGRTR